MDRSAHEANRLSWNAVTPAHNRHKGDQAAFLRAGGTTLFDEERVLVGDVRGQRLVHLQCNCGQDTLSWVTLGADAVGVDISDAAVDFARALSRDAGLPARFERADVLDWLAASPERFDVAFASYGTLAWLSDLRAYFDGVARVLAGGGRYVLMEFHPTAWIFGLDWTWRFPYSSGGEPLVEPGGVSDYVQASGSGLLMAAPGAQLDLAPFENPFPSREFIWGLGDILGAALGAGLRIERLVEYPYANGWRGFDGMTPLLGNRWAPPPDRPSLPLMFGLVLRSAAAA